MICVPSAPLVHLSLAFCVTKLLRGFGQPRRFFFSFLKMSSFLRLFLPLPGPRFGLFEQGPPSPMPRALEALPFLHPLGQAGFASALLSR